MSERTCVVCSTTLIGRQQRYCSPLCASRGLNAARKADGRLKAQRQHLAGYRAAYQKANAKRWYKDATCEICGKGFRSKHGPRWCSPSCVGEALRRGLWQRPTPKPNRRAVAQRKQRKAARGTRGGTGAWVQGHCVRCDAYFLARKQRHQAAAYCSTECRLGDGQARRRARQRDAPKSSERVFRRRVFERDKWRCHLCGKPVKRKAKVPESLAPTLDHVIPIALGGLHTPANVRCAHFICNSKKGALAGANEQLMLIG